MFSLCPIFSEIILSFRMFVHVFTSDRYWIIWYIYHHLTKPYGITIFFTSNLNMLSCFYYTTISDRYSLNRRVLTWSTNTRVLDNFIVEFPSVIIRRLTYLLNNIKKNTFTCNAYNGSPLIRYMYQILINLLEKY